MKPFRLTAALTLLAFATASTCLASGKTSVYDQEEADIPTNPSTPRQFVVKPPDAKLFHCERNFQYQGKNLTCDSSLRQDGEGLRPIIKDNAQAVSELDQYQNNRRTIKTAAYVASAGILIALVALLASKADTFDGPSIRTIGVGSGLILTAGSFIYGFSALSANESHLDRAVQYYNGANPQKPIELKFSTGINF
jgi:hypothetical protein